METLTTKTAAAKNSNDNGDERISNINSNNNDLNTIIKELEYQSELSQKRFRRREQELLEAIKEKDEEIKKLRKRATTAAAVAAEIQDKNSIISLGVGAGTAGINGDRNSINHANNSTSSYEIKLLEKCNEYEKKLKDLQYQYDILKQCKEKLMETCDELSYKIIDCDRERDNLKKKYFHLDDELRQTKEINAKLQNEISILKITSQQQQRKNCGGDGLVINNLKPINVKTNSLIPSPENLRVSNVSKTTKLTDDTSDEIQTQNSLSPLVNHTPTKIYTVTPNFNKSCKIANNMNKTTVANNITTSVARSPAPYCIPTLAINTTNKNGGISLILEHFEQKIRSLTDELNATIKQEIKMRKEEWKTLLQDVTISNMKSRKSIDNALQEIETKVKMMAVQAAPIQSSFVASDASTVSIQQSDSTDAAAVTGTITTITTSDLSIATVTSFSTAFSRKSTKNYDNHPTVDNNKENINAKQLIKNEIINNESEMPSIVVEKVEEEKPIKKTKKRGGGVSSRAAANAAATAIRKVLKEENEVKTVMRQQIKQNIDKQQVKQNQQQQKQDNQQIQNNVFATNISKEEKQQPTSPPVTIRVITRRGRPAKSCAVGNSVSNATDNITNEITSVAATVEADNLLPKMKATRTRKTARK